MGAFSQEGAAQPASHRLPALALRSKLADRAGALAAEAATLGRDLAQQGDVVAELQGRLVELGEEESG